MPTNPVICPAESNVSRQEVKWAYGCHHIKIGAKLTMINKLLILSIICAFSLAFLYLVQKYYWPPITNIPPSEIAQTATIVTNYGEINIVLDGQSRFAVSQFTRLCREGFYDGIRFHRIVPGLLIETGDPLTKFPQLKHFWGQGGLGTSFSNQTYKTDRFVPGTVAFTGSKAKTFGSHFFISTQTTNWLNQKHTIIGRVVSGMDVVKQIESASASGTGLPVSDIIIHSVSCL